MRGVFAALELALELAAAWPGARQLPANTGGLENGEQPGAIAASMALKPCFQVLGVTEVMTRMLERLVKMNEINHGFLSLVVEIKAEAELRSRAAQSHRLGVARAIAIAVHFDRLDAGRFAVDEAL